MGKTSCLEYEAEIYLDDRKKYEEQSKILRNQAITEMKHPLYKNLRLRLEYYFIAVFFTIHYILY